MLANEQHLIAQVRDDPNAFRELYRHYFPRVYGYIASRVGRTQDAEDLASETFLKAIEGLDSFQYRGEGAFAAWLFRIATNVVSGFYRKNPNVLIPLDTPIMSDSPPLEAILMQQENAALLHRLVQTLPQRRQEVITLKYFGGLRNQEIAHVLNLDERTVASHLSRGLEDLYEKYEQAEVRR